MKTVYNDYDKLKECGFEGGITILNLKNSCAELPEIPGVYFITKPIEQSGSFLSVGTGGHYKGKDPNVSVSELQSNWVEKTIVVYIGKATSLKKRLRQYMQFGCGKNIGHWGGRYIWQLAYADQLQVWWKPTSVPRETESKMIKVFKQEYGMRPFANLQD